MKGIGSRKPLTVTLLVLCAILCATVSGCGGGQSQKAGGGASSGSSTASSPSQKATYEFRICCLAPEADPVVVGYRKLGEMLLQKTNGQIKTAVFPGQQISKSDRENAEKTQQNIVQMTTCPSYTLAELGNLPEFCIMDYPYLFQTDAEIYKVTDGSIGQEMGKKALDKMGLRTYGWFVNGWVLMGSNKKPIQAPADVKGLKIRSTTAEMYIETLKAWGASPTPMAFGEVFTALQQGTVDGLVTAANIFVTDRMYEVQKYGADVNPFAIVHVPVVNNSWYQALPADLKATFDSCMKEYVQWMREEEAKAQKAAIQELRKKGMTITELTPEQKRLFIEPTVFLLDKKAELVGKEFMAKVRQALGR